MADRIAVLQKEVALLSPQVQNSISTQVPTSEKNGLRPSKEGRLGPAVYSTLLKRDAWKISKAKRTGRGVAVVYCSIKTDGPIYNAGFVSKRGRVWQWPIGVVKSKPSPGRTRLIQGLSRSSRYAVPRGSRSSASKNGGEHGSVALLQHS